MLVPFVNTTFLGQPYDYIANITDPSALHSVKIGLGLTTILAATILPFVG
jgi:hypothetical protein